MEKLSIWENSVLPALTQHLSEDRIEQAKDFLNSVLHYGVFSTVSESQALPAATHIITEHTLVVEPSLVAAELHTFLCSGIMESFELKEGVDPEAERLSMAAKAFIESYPHFFA